ncbi:unnamed protein product [Adineta ricciae]|uniref:Uncharacterized protein n=1 Tax=Adineta ricciae TaxID=249248 RepID=A0A815K0V7_ADIRI|nr:unnamed protein product [Adineta ricciae]CAF1478147.1 unnamed protein product [Adineta ricciae]
MYGSQIQNGRRDQIRKQQKILIILTALGLVTGVVISTFETVLMGRTKNQSQTIDVEEKILDRFNDAWQDMVLECLCLYFIIKLDRIGILMFAWIAVAGALLFSVHFVASVFFAPKPASVSGSIVETSGPTVSVDIFYIILGFIGIIIFILQVIYLFKLSKSLKQHISQCGSQQTSLI